MHPSQRSQSKLDMLDVWVTDFCLADWEIGQIINPIFWKDFRYSSTRGIQKIWWSETFHQKKQWCINSDTSVRSLVWCDSFFCDSHGFMMDLWPLLWLSPAPGQDPTDLRIWQGYEEGKISTTWFPWWLDFAGKDSHLICKTTFNMISFFNVHLSNARLNLVILNSNADTSDPSGCRQRDLLELGCPVAVRVDGRQTVCYSRRHVIE